MRLRSVLNVGWIAFGVKDRVDRNILFYHNIKYPIRKASEYPASKVFMNDWATMRESKDLRQTSIHGSKKFKT